MLHTYDNEELLLRATADFFIQQGVAAILKHGTFHVALSGGSSPRKLYTLLSSDEYRRRIDWSQIHFFFGDERFVPHDDEDSNYRMANETLFMPLPIPKANIHPVETTYTPTEAATRYEETIRTVVSSPFAFDLILLGLGGDAHTASLFPGTSVLSEEHAFVKEVFLQDKNVFRITLTAPFINRGRMICFLVYGASKADAVHHVLKGSFSPEHYPAQLIKPTAGEVHWFMDKDASAQVTK